MPDPKHVIHVHSSAAFATWGKAFDMAGVRNSGILISNSIPSLDDCVEVYSPNNLREIAAKCEKADLVVLWGLNAVNQRLALRIPQGIKLAWRFFGYEIYKNFPETFLSARTREALLASSNKVVSLRSAGGLLFNRLKTLIRPEPNFSKVLHRIDYVLMVCDEEYELVSRYCPEVPAFIKLPFPLPAPIKPDDEAAIRTGLAAKVSEVVIGNSRSPYNNHLDILASLESLDGYAKFTIFFSYGEESGYTREVRNLAARNRNVTIEEKFLPKEIFNSVYRRSSAFISNSINQHAIGNIVAAILNHTKVYLHPSNILLQWLRGEGFRIFETPSFPEDLRSGQIKLSFDDAIANQAALRRVLKPDFIKVFLENLKLV
jgi:hypothetical protein